MHIQLQNVKLPDFGSPKHEPSVKAKTYQTRIDAAMARAQARGLSALVVFADREHSANIAYLTGFEPRFEEAVLVLTPGRIPALITGNECQSYANICPVPVRKVLFQDFSLLAQPRDKSDLLENIFRAEGITNGSHVGTVGWKYYTDARIANPAQRLEIPSFIADILRDLTGDRARVVNATDLFMNATDGLRIINEVDQLAVFEYAATVSSTGIRDALFGIKPGMTEYETVRLMKLNGMPLSCHPVVMSGERTNLGLAGPSSRKLKKGDRLCMGLGLWGGLTCRAGFLVKSEKELPKNIRDYADKLVKPYFTAVTEWYQTIGLGVRGGELYDIVHKHIGDPFFGVSLNPGHQVHLDEWVNAPVDRGSKIEFKSGMAMQVDIIPSTGTDYFTTNIEDTIALADEDLRKAFKKDYPEAWRRITARRKFVEQVLGIKLKPEVLLFSNIPAYLPPFILSPQRVMTVKS
jgi:hypothetical protein